MCSVEKFQNLVPELVSLGSWLRNLIKTFQVSEFLNPVGSRKK